MAKPCAVFWDIESIAVPKGQTVDSIVDLIRSTIIVPYNLNETFFFCVCDLHNLPDKAGQSLARQHVHIVQAYSEIGDSATDIKIEQLMSQFIEAAGLDCTIMLVLNGDADYYDILNELKTVHNVPIHLISLADSFPTKLDQISDCKFSLHNGVLKPVGSNGLPMYFISIKNYPLTMDIKVVMDDLNSQTTGSVQRSAIYFEDTIYIGFPTLWFAERAIEQLDGTDSHGNVLKIELIGDSPLADILKCINHDMTVQIKSVDEAKQLTFIEMNSSKEAVDKCKIIEFCIACTVQAGSQCILSTRSFLWVVFSYLSDAQKCLPKFQIMYPDAVISKPPNDLISTRDKNSYAVAACNQKVQNEELQSVYDDNDLRIFFRSNAHLLASMPSYEQTTKWSLLYNVFEKLYAFGAKKVIFDGDLYCASFDSVSAYQDAFGKIHSRYIEPLEQVDASEEHKQKVIKIMDQYINGIPWCLNQELDLLHLFIKIDSNLHNHFIEISKNRLVNLGCIFIKSQPKEIWLCFPDTLICKNSLHAVLKKISSDIGAPEKPDYWIIKPSSELLKSINLRDLVGDAYDLAYLSNYLEISKPRILERISLQRVQEKECHKLYFYAHITGKFYRSPWPQLDAGEIVKIFVNFSKVIPVAATASHSKVTLIYKTWHEAYAACHFINNLTLADVPYFTELSKSTVYRPFTCRDIFSFYIINDKRRFLDKILQNKSLVNGLGSNSPAVQTTKDIDAKDEEKKKKFQHVFVITTDCDFKLTSGMISIIIACLEENGCPVSIEVEDKIWVGVDDLEKGNKAKAIIEQIYFYILHENDDDFKVKLQMQLVKNIPNNVAKILENSSNNTTKSLSRKDFIYVNSDVVPLGHFNYSYRKAVGMSISRYCQLNGQV